MSTGAASPQPSEAAAAAGWSLTLDPQGAVTWFSPDAVSAFGAVQPINAWIELWPEALGDQARDALVLANAGKVARLQGTSRFGPPMSAWEAILIPAPAGPDGDRSIHVAVRDVTADNARAEELAAEATRFRLMADNATDIIARCDMAGTLLYVSPSCRTFGYEPEELIGHSAEQHVHPEDLAGFRANSALLLAGEMDQSSPRLHRYRTKAGDWVWLEGAPQIIRNAQGRPIEILSAFRDVSERRRAELALEHARGQQRRQAERMRLAVHAAQVGIWEWDLTTDTLLWDERMLELYGRRWTGEPPTSSYFKERLHDEDRDRVMAEIQQALEGRRSFDTEFRIVPTSGEIRYVRSLATVIRRKDGTATQMVGTNWDITATRDLEAGLIASQARMRNVIAHAHQAIVTIDQAGLVVAWNLQAEAIFGWPEAEAMGQPVADLIVPPDHQAIHTDRMRRILDSDEDTVLDERAELTALRKSGEAFPIELAVSAVRGPAGWELTALMQDITARKSRTELFENAFRHAPIGMGLIGLDGAFLRVNTAFCEIVGLPEAEMLAVDFQAITHPDDLEADLGLLGQLMAGEIPSYQMDKRYIRADKSIVWVRLSVSLVQENDGSPKYFVAQVQDLTARRDAEHRYRILAEAATDVVLKVGLDGTIQYVSPSVARYGYSPDELVHQPITQLVHHDDLARVAETLGSLASGRMSESTDRSYRVRMPDGRYAWFEGSSSMIRDDAGQPMAMVSQLRDISERRAHLSALAESEARYRAIADNCTDVISRVNARRNVTYLSPSVTEVVGYAPEELIGVSMRNILHPDDVETVLSAYDDILVGTPRLQPLTYRARHKAGHWIYLEGNPIAVPDADGTAVEVIDVARDITARVRLDAELRAARDAAETAAAAKSDFLANMSHEIRTPLTAILGFTDLLKARPDLDDTARDQIAKVVGAGEVLLSIVNDVLDFSKLEAGQVEITPRAVAPDSLMKDILTLFSPQAEAKGLALRFVAGELPQAVRIDPERVRQVLLNLIGNAMKFTEAGEVRLVVGHDGERLSVEVEDTGAGLDIDQQAKLFQRFSQVDGSSTRRHGGTGLGLAISKGLVEAMGGEIGVRSVPGQGATFHFTIAAPPTELEAPVAAATAQADGIEGASVLVIDDNPMNRELARAILGHLGAEVIDAPGGLEGLEVAGQRRFDVILLDIRMPGLDGPATLARLRATPGPNQDVPVLAFSADAELEYLRALGFDGIVPKPIDAAYLAGAVSAAARWRDEADETEVA